MDFCRACGGDEEEEEEPPCPLNPLSFGKEVSDEDLELDETLPSEDALFKNVDCGTDSCFCCLDAACLL